MPETILEPQAPAFAASWPETPCEAVNVICEGPSSWRNPERLEESLLEGPVVAINRALAFSGYVPVDLWAAIDDPRNLWEWSTPYLAPETKLFTTDSKVILWQKYIEPGAMEKLYAWHETPMDEMKDENGLAPVVPTLFSLLGWLLSTGAKKINLLGADFAGNSSPMLEDWQETPDEGFQLRWGVERKMLALSMRHYRAKGARIERWMLSKRP